MRVYEVTVNYIIRAEDDTDAEVRAQEFIPFPHPPEFSRFDIELIG